MSNLTIPVPANSPNSSALFDCNLAVTIQVTPTGCLCNAGWYGVNCTLEIWWWRGAYTALRVYATTFLLIGLYWNLLKMAHLYFAQKTYFNLCSFSLLCNLIAVIMRIMWLWFPDQQLAGDSTSINPWVDNFFLTLPNILLLTAFSLVIAFWFEIILSKRLQLRFYEISKIIIFAVLPFMIIICLICMSVASIGIQRFWIFCGCQDAVIFGIILIAAVGLLQLKIHRGTEFASDTWKRVLKMSFGIMVGSGIWFVYAISLIIYFSAFLSDTIPPTESITIYFIHRSVEWSLAINLLYIADWRHNPITLSIWLFLDKDKDDDEDDTSVSGSGGSGSVSAKITQ